MMEFNLKNAKNMIGDKVIGEADFSNVELEIERKDVVMIYGGLKGKVVISDKGIHIQGGKK